MRIRAPAPDAVLLLGDVRQLEVRREGTEDTGLPLEGERRHGGGQVLMRCARARRPGERADALDVVEELLPVLLYEDPAEEVAEEPDVAAKRGIGGLVGTNCHACRVGRWAGETGQSLSKGDDPR
jgi:hypothetical protein